MKGLIAGLVFLMLSGCVHVWCNPGASQEAFSQVRYACMSGNAHPYTNVSVGSAAVAGPYGAAASSGASVNSGVAINPYMFRACMEASGYQWTTPKQCNEAVPSRPASLDPCVISKTAICTDSAPPKAKAEFVTAKPSDIPSDWIWEPGFYQWNPNTGYQWTDGQWAPPRAGYHWYAPHWAEHPEGKWMFVPGYWVKV
jgi:hypothetical protein